MTLTVGAAAKRRTASAYVTLSATRILYNRDVMAACVRNWPALLILLEKSDGSELARLVKSRDQEALDTQAAFLRVAESASDTRDCAAACRILDPVCIFLRLIDGEGSRSSLVLPAARNLERDILGLETRLRDSGLAGSASPGVSEQLCAALRKRMSGPIDRSVRVLFLAGILFLAAALDPKVFEAQADDVVVHALPASQAIRTFSLRSPDAVSVEQL